MGLIECRSCHQMKEESEFRNNPNATWRRCTECASLNRQKGFTKKILTPADKREIIALYSKGTYNGRELAEKYNVSDATIYRVLNTGHTKTVRERNNRIREEFLAGVSVEDLAMKYGLKVDWIIRMQFLFEKGVIKNR
jgi:hypothetical protein